MNLDPTIIDAVIAVAMAFMALSVTLLVGALISVIWKGRDTLGAIEKLCNTVDQEVGPTAVQLREVMDGLNQLRGVTTQRITAVAHKAEEVSDTLGTAVGTASKHSNVWGAGLLAGFRAYLNGKPNESASTDKQIIDRGERHELKQ